MFVWHHLVASQIYSWPLVTGTDLPPCWSLKEPIPNDLGKRQPLAVIFLAILLGHLLSAAWRSGKCHRLTMQLKETPCAGDFGGKTWSWEGSYYRRHWIFPHIGPGQSLIAELQIKSKSNQTKNLERLYNCLVVRSFVCSFGCSSRSPDEILQAPPDLPAPW